MSNHSEPGTMGDAPADEVTSQSEAAMQDTSVAPGTPARQGGVAVPGASAAALGPHPPYHGRRISWIAAGIMVVGFIVGGLALILGDGGPTWWAFWVGVAVAGLGLLISLATNMFEDWY